MKLNRIIAESVRVILHEGRALLRVDLTSAIVVLIFLCFFLPTIAIYAENAQMLASRVGKDDEPFIAMQLDGMTTRPYGNPANYLDGKHDVPQYWGNLRYTGLQYYGGFYLDIALAVWAPLKLAGLPTFPTLPIVLRSIALIFTVATLLAIYNIGRIYMGKMAAMIALLYMATDYHLLSIGTFIHPDSLLFYLTFLVLVLCVRHARDGALESLLAIGVVAGLAQATKMGGPPLIPIVILSVFVGIKHNVAQNANCATWVLRQLLYKGSVVALVAVAVFIITTPYAVIDPYFITSWKHATKVFLAGNQATSTNLIGWCSDFYHAMGPVFLSACGLALVGHTFNSNRHVESLPLIFFALLSVSIFLWYASFQKIWVQLQYLVVTFAFIAATAGYLLDQLFNRMFPVFTNQRLGATTLRIAVAAMFLFFMEPQLYIAMKIPMNYAGWRHYPQMQVGDWLQANQPNATGVVLIDSQAYFDPHAFPKQFGNGGPIKYTDLERVRPDYFVLSVYEPQHYWSQNMRLQRNDKWNDDYASMKLYQDLLGYDALNISVQKDLPGIQFIKSFGRHEWRSNGIIEPGADGNKWELIFKHYDRLASAWSSIFLFRLDHAKFVVPK